MSAEVVLPIKVTEFCIVPIDSVGFPGDCNVRNGATAQDSRTRHKNPVALFHRLHRLVPFLPPRRCFDQITS